MYLTLFSCLIQYMSKNIYSYFKWFTELSKKNQKILLFKT